MERMWFKLGILGFILSILGLFGNFFMIFVEYSGINIGCNAILNVVEFFFISGIIALILGIISRFKKEKNILVLLAIIFGINSIWVNIMFIMVVAMACSP